MLVAVAAAVWFFLLSGFLGVKHGTAIVERIDSFFSADTLRWLQGFDGLLPIEFSLRHPLKWFTILPVGQALAKLTTPMFGRDTAVVLVGRLVNAAFAGLGVGALFRATRAGTSPGWGAWAALSIYLLFSASALAAIPEHFGISTGLLSLTFLVAASAREAKKQAIAMVPMGIIVGGLTLTNGLYPLGVLGAAILQRLGINQRWVMPAAVIGMLVGLTAVVAVGARVAQKARGGTSVLVKTTNLRLVKDPVAAVRYAAHGLIDPAIAPSPHLDGDPPIMTYEPVQGWGYGQARLPGVAAWLLLLTFSIGACLRDEPGRRILWLTAPWVAFNLVFHNLWGDEFFLYSAHWAWCLGAVILAGARRLPAWFVAALGIAIVFGQVTTLVEFRNALAMLPL